MFVQGRFARFNSSRRERAACVVRSRMPEQAKGRTVLHLAGWRLEQDACHAMPVHQQMMQRACSVRSTGLPILHAFIGCVRSCAPHVRPAQPRPTRLTLHPIPTRRTSIKNRSPHSTPPTPPQPAQPALLWRDCVSGRYFLKKSYHAPDATSWALFRGFADINLVSSQLELFSTMVPIRRSVEGVLDT